MARRKEEETISAEEILEQYEGDKAMVQDEGALETVEEKEEE